MADIPTQEGLKKLKVRYAAAAERLKDAKWRVNIFKARLEGECRRNRLSPKNIELKHINPIEDISGEVEPAYALLVELDSIIDKYPNLTKEFRLESYRNNLMGFLKELFRDFLDFYRGAVLAAANIAQELHKMSNTSTEGYNLQVPYAHTIALRTVERIGGMGNSLAFRYACKNIDETKRDYVELWRLGNRVKNQLLDGLKPY
jgi:hypothetical protein